MANRAGPPILSQSDGAKIITHYINKRSPFTAGKLGTSELNALWFYVSNRHRIIKPSYPQIVMKHMTINAGLFPATNEALDAWADHMLKHVLPNMTILAEWTKTSQERLILNMVSPYSVRIPLRSLEPYYESDTSIRWTYNIPESSTIAIISPFAHTIKQQWIHRNRIWPSNNMWPTNLTIVPIQCGYSPALQPNSKSPNAWSIDIQNAGWQAAVHSMVAAAADSGSTLAVVGAGCISLPIVAGLKEKGIAAIHMGGATQILFGIKGQRWISHEFISSLFNDAWVFPCADEIPDEAQRVEEACYW